MAENRWYDEAGRADSDATGRTEPSRDDAAAPEVEAAAADARTNDATTYYYAYPSAYSASYSSSNLRTERAGYGAVDAQGGQRAERTEIRALYPAVSRPHGTARPQEWTVRPKRGGMLRTVLVSMLVGALTMGGLMFASDRYDWFGGSATSARTAATGGGNGVDNGVRVAANTPAQSSGSAAALPMNIADMVEKASPAVVKIETYSTRSTNRFFDDDIFRFFFGDEWTQPSRPNQPQPIGMGSGFFFDKAGYILTNEHVISGADEIYVTVLGHKDRYKAQKLGTSRDLDLAVLKINGNGDFPTLPFGDSDKLRVGDWVTAIGNPVGFDHSVSVGVLSAKERKFDIRDGAGSRTYDHMLQTDASINPGNSGGPLLNLAGEVVGINTAVSAQAQGIGFAIPSSTVLEVLDNLKNNVKTPVPFLGITMRDVAGLPDEWKKQLGISSDEGVIVVSVIENGPAAKSDIQPYDVIVSFDGQTVKNAEDLQAKLKATKPGQRVSIGLIREGRRMTTAVIVGDRNDYVN